MTQPENDPQAKRPKPIEFTTSDLGLNTEGKAMSEKPSPLGEQRSPYEHMHPQEVPYEATMTLSDSFLVAEYENEIKKIKRFALASLLGILVPIFGIAFGGYALKRNHFLKKQGVILPSWVLIVAILGIIIGITRTLIHLYGVFNTTCYC